MGVDLRFYMIKRGLTIEKIITKHNIQSLEDFLTHMRKMDVTVPKSAYDEIEVHLAEKTEPITIDPALLLEDAVSVTEEEIIKILPSEGSKKKKKSHLKE